MKIKQTDRNSQLTAHTKSDIIYLKETMEQGCFAAVQFSRVKGSDCVG
ncbi:MAG: hypothetical protein LBQ21_02775 [Clostridiales Family XIII bacterium]|jgi:hypothetical protein|nr:hypothetical protein [Clostridiales Family XIII bacterium]